MHRLTARLRLSAPAACPSPILPMQSPHRLTHAQEISSSAGANSCLAEGYLLDARAACDHWCKSWEGALVMPTPIGVMDV